LFLAHNEGKLATAPSIDLLPEDDSTPVVPPTEQQYEVLLKLSADFRPVAPYMPEAIDFDAETGLRLAEQFNLAWASVDRERNALRVETQARVRLVNGRPWKPKYNKWREVPLSRRARDIVEKMYKEVPHGPNDLVFPNRGGAPYVRMDRAPE